MNYLDDCDLAVIIFGIIITLIMLIGLILCPIEKVMDALLYYVIGGMLAIIYFLFISGTNENARKKE